MKTAKHGDRVKINFIGKFEDGSVFETSEGKEPLEFTIGDNSTMPALEDGIVGMKEGESRTIPVTPEIGFGTYQEKRIEVISKKNVPEDLELKVGMVLPGKNKKGGGFKNMTITKIDDESITLDGNHPYAGKNLTLEVELIELP